MPVVWIASSSYLWASATLIFVCASFWRSHEDTSDNKPGYFPAFHPRPMHNWVNDPNGPMYFNGSYHLFMQYNPDGYNWGDMHWSHLISKDLLHWTDLPIALAPDKDYDCGGIFSGSATIIDGTPVLTYSVQCGKVMIHAVPAPDSDSDLTRWVKPIFNPIMNRPSDTKDFRDPTEGWQGKDGVWRMLTGCNKGSCMWKSKDFIDWTYTGIFFPTTGFAECPDFFVIPGTDKWVYKGSDGGRDWYVIGDYIESEGIKTDKYNVTSAPFQQNNQLYDVGNFYASKTFYDTPNNRRVLFGWTNYHCDGTDWSGIQTIPRVLSLDPITKNTLITYPIPELVNLRNPSTPPQTGSVDIGASFEYSIVTGAQVDVIVRFSKILPGKEYHFGLDIFKDPSTGNGLRVKFDIAADSTASLNGNPFPLYPQDNQIVSTYNPTLTQCPNNSMP
ncbi:hypothetical protein AAMO2058_000998500 [Amorphochlora amoebiformis]